VEESLANKISISNRILGIGENQPSTSSTTRAENEMGTSSQLPSTAKSSQPQVPNSLPKIIVKNCTNCKVDVLSVDIKTWDTQNLLIVYQTFELSLKIKIVSI
jgi:hypothetical protein